MGHPPESVITCGFCHSQVGRCPNSGVAESCMERQRTINAVLPSRSVSKAEVSEAVLCVGRMYSRGIISSDTHLKVVKDLSGGV
jgi:hypothetical protein